MNNYFKLVREMKISKGIKAKCYVEIILTIILRMFTFYPLLLLGYVFTGLAKVFEFLDNLFFNVIGYLKENVGISILSEKEFEEIKKELKRVTMNKFEVK